MAQLQAKATDAFMARDKELKKMRKCESQARKHKKKTKPLIKKDIHMRKAFPWSSDASRYTSLNLSHPFPSLIPPHPHQRPKDFRIQ